MKKKQLLQILQDRYPEEEKKDLFAKVLCGDIKVNGECVKDPKRTFPGDIVISFGGKGFVSRGGNKLNHALHIWDISPRGMVFLDAGSSTGGFTDCLLKAGAEKVHSVDVGYNQLDYSLRTNPDVIVHERKNIMAIEDLDPKPDAAVADLSFRSIGGASSHILSLTKDKWLIALIKPQFEWENPPEEFDGIIRDPEIVREVALGVVDSLAEEGVYVHKAALSPIKGAAGNTELLFLLSDTEAIDKPVVKHMISGLF